LNELRILAQSVDYLADKYEVNMLSLSPDEEEKQKLAEYNILKENLNRILSSLVQVDDASALKKRVLERSKSSI
jgi:hypothetical protein